MLTEKERGIVSGFRQWAEALKRDDGPAMRAIEREWYKDARNLIWNTKAERNMLIRRLHNSGLKPGIIAYKLGINRLMVWRVLRGDHDNV